MTEKQNNNPETVWRTLNIRKEIKTLLVEIGKASGNGFSRVPMARVIEDLVLARHRELFNNDQK